MSVYSRPVVIRRHNPVRLCSHFERHRRDRDPIRRHRSLLTLSCITQNDLLVVEHIFDWTLVLVIHHTIMTGWWTGESLGSTCLTWHIFPKRLREVHRRECYVLDGDCHHVYDKFVCHIQTAWRIPWTTTSHWAVVSTMRWFIIATTTRLLFFRITSPLGWLICLTGAKYIKRLQFAYDNAYSPSINNDHRCVKADLFQVQVALSKNSVGNSRTCRARLNLNVDPAAKNGLILKNYSSTA